MGQLTDLIARRTSQKFATKQGIDRHEQMRRVIIDGNTTRGDPDIVRDILSRPELIPYFGPQSQTEVPIAGLINGRFISRRIDRLIINHDYKQIVFLDYKSDLDKVAFHDKYVHQMQEYAQLLSDIYPNYAISGLILWLKDFTIEKIC